MSEEEIEIIGRYPKEWDGIPSVTEVLEFVPKKKLYEYWKRSNYADIIRTQKEAMEVGTLTNELIDRIETGEEVTTDIPHAKKVISAIKRYLEWRRGKNMRFVSSQTRVMHKEIGYKGTIDRLEMDDNGLILIDWKAAKQLWITNQMQVIAYKKAYEHMHKERINRCLLVRLDKDGKEFNPEKDVLEVTDQDDEKFGCFVDLLRFYKSFSIVEAKDDNS